MIEELQAASNLFATALERYLDACLAVRNCYLKGSRFESILREHSERVVTERLLATSYETKLKQAKAAISLAVNSSTTTTTINSLPSEILARIFHLVSTANHCNIQLSDFRVKANCPRYPDYLSHVCSRWRQVAIGSCTLWSHIDIVPYHPPSQGFLNRGHACAARSGHMPLEIHSIDPDFRALFDDISLVPFLTSVSTRIRSLELVLRSESWDSTRSYLNSFFGNCVPGMFTSLTLKDKSYLALGFIEAAENPPAHESLLLNLPRQFLDDLWHSITVLRLDGLYPYWTSKAYHGLVELRLHSSRHPISESQLVGILKSSPGLRVLHLDLSVEDPCPRNTSINPASLEDLEYLSFHSDHYSYLWLLLRWIAPGQKPLQLSISDTDDMEQFLLGGEVKDFFARSSIVKLRVHVSGGPILPLQVAKLLDLSPGLRTLALSDCTCEQDNSPVLESHKKNTSSLSSGPHLDGLYMIRAHIGFEELQEIVTRHSIQALTFWQCTFSVEERGVFNQEEFETHLSAICPVVSFVDFEEPSPIEDWDMQI